MTLADLNNEMVNRGFFQQEQKAEGILKDGICFFTEFDGQVQVEIKLQTIHKNGEDEIPEASMIKIVGMRAII